MVEGHEESALRGAFDDDGAGSCLVRRDQAVVAVRQEMVDECRHRSERWSATDRRVALLVAARRWDRSKEESRPEHHHELVRQVARLAQASMGSGSVARKDWSREVLLHVDPAIKRHWLLLCK